MNLLTRGENSIVQTKSLKQLLVCDEILMLLDIYEELSSLLSHQKHIFALGVQSKEEINKTITLQRQIITAAFQIARRSANRYQQTISMREQQKSLDKQFFKKIMRSYEDKIQNLKIRLEMQEIQIQNLQINSDLQGQLSSNLDYVLKFSINSQYVNSYFEELKEKQLCRSKFTNATRLKKARKLSPKQILKFILLKQQIIEENLLRELRKIQNMEEKYESQKAILRESLKEANKTLNRTSLTYFFDEQRTKADYESFLKCLKKDILLSLSANSSSYLSKNRKRSKSCHAIVKSSKVCTLSQKIIETQSQLSFLQDCLHFVSEKFIVSDILDHQY